MKRSTRSAAIAAVAAAAAVAAWSAFAGEAPRAPVTKPPPLRKGDAVGLVAPASPVEEEKVVQARDFLLSQGYRVKVSYAYRKPLEFLASADADRIGELHAMFRDPEVRAIVCLRGGYGSPRILDGLDYDLIRENPKILVGYSDITALLNAIRARTGLVVFHGPMGKELAAAGGLSEYTARHFWRLLESPSLAGAEWGTAVPDGGRRRTATLVPGAAEGVLAGGNLSVLTCAIGTPYEVDTRDAILFLEETNEEPFRIDRMLNHLRLAGKLRTLRGVLLGMFTNCEGAAAGSLEAVFLDYFVPLGIPVLAKFPAGHVTDQATLPLGVRVRLDATAQRLTLLEAAVSGAPAAE